MSIDLESSRALMREIWGEEDAQHMVDVEDEQLARDATTHIRSLRGRLRIAEAEHDEVRAERDAIQNAFDACADDFSEMRRESWLMGVRLREARDEVERLRAAIVTAPCASYENKGSGLCSDCECWKAAALRD